jgi:hypothetical protein
MMSAVYLEGYDAPTVSPAPELTRRIAYKLDRTVDGKTGYGSEISHNTITVDSDVSGCFLYLTMNGVNAPDKKDVFEKRAYIYLDDIRKVSLNVETGNWPWRRGCTSYTFALGYVENDISRMTFDCEFDFDPDTLTVTAVPFEVFENAYNEQTAQTLKNVSFDGNSVSGHIDLSSDRVLSVGIVYSTGWKAYVDGEPAKLYKSNSVFLGLPLSAGSHDIRLEYSEPYGAEGATVSLIGILSAAAFEVVIRKRKKRVSKPEGSE